MNTIARALTDDRISVVLCATERQARDYRSQSAVRRMSLGQSAWFANQEVLIVPVWLQELWESLLPTEQLLSPVQELAVIKRIIDNSNLLPDTMVSSMGVARSVLKAYNLCHRFNLSNDEDYFRFQPEYEAFHRWRVEIDQYLRSTNSIMLSQLPGLLASNIKMLDLPEALYINVGVSLSPEEMSFFDELKEHGVEIIHVSSGGEGGAGVYGCASKTLQDECVAIASWCADILTDYKHEPSLAPSICVAVPDMSTYQGALENALSEYLYPSALTGSISETLSPPWEFVGCFVMGDYPVVNAAMDILMSSPKSTEVERFSRILRSPYIGENEIESGPRADSDLSLRDRCSPAVSFNNLYWLLKNTAAGKDIGHFISRFERLCQHLSQTSSRALPSTWVNRFTECLQIMGWPGKDPLDSDTHQVVESFRHLLESFGSLDRQLGEVTSERAVMWFREIVDTRPFQPKRNHLVNIRIMSAQDARGMAYDYLWVAGLTATNVPSECRPNPFLPLTLQEKAELPQSSPEVSLRDARKLYDGLIRENTKAVLSYYEREENGAENRLSPLFSQYDLSPLKESKQASILSENTIKLEIRSDDEIPRVSAQESSTILGGISILKKHAESPFVAFARYRLNIRAFPEVKVGFDHRIQGDALHQVLDVFWKTHRNSETLERLINQGELAAEIDSAINKVFEERVDLAAWRHGHRLTLLERQRIHDLVSNWLEFESSRVAPFEVVGAETSYECYIQGLKIKFRLDRIDKVMTSDGEKGLVFDYKSGDVNASHLNAESLLEPQLPIYACYASPSTVKLNSFDGICLASIQADQIKLHMRSSWANSVVEKRPNRADVATPPAWDGQIDAWRKRIDENALDFLSGNGSYDFGGVLNRFDADLKPLLREKENLDRLMA